MTASILNVLCMRIPQASPPALLMSYALLRALGQRQLQVYRWFVWDHHTWRLPGLFHKLVHNVWAGYYAAQATATLADDARTAYAPALPVPETPGLVSTASLLTVTTDHHIWLAVECHALSIMYNILGIAHLPMTELRAISSHFVEHLFAVMEQTDSEWTETYITRIMHVLLALYEQSLLHPALPSTRSAMHQCMQSSKVFGENLVYLLNRTPSTTLEGGRLHFLILKLLASFFALPETASYFYTNDLRVLVDIFIRQVSDLPESWELLRQSYLCVFHELLTQTQLCTEAYKRDQVRMLLQMIVKSAQYHDVSQLTMTLAEHCLSCEWLVGFSHGHTVVETIQGDAVQDAPLTKERVDGEAHYVAEPCDETIRQVLVLSSVQSATASLVCLNHMYQDQMEAVLWPEQDPNLHSDAVNDGLSEALDLVSLESFSRRSSSESIRSTEGRRRPPPPPLPRRSLRPNDAVSRAASASMPDLTQQSSAHSSPTSSPRAATPARRRPAPDIPRERAHSLESSPVQATTPLPQVTVTPANQSRPLRYYFRKHFGASTPTDPPEPHRLSHWYTRYRASRTSSPGVPEDDDTPARTTTPTARRRAPPPPPGPPKTGPL